MENPPSLTSGYYNTSGMGRIAALPPGVAGWSWGALLLNWVWALGNGVWIGLLCLIPGVNLVVAVVLAAKGREWSWRNRRWDSRDHFLRVQARWSKCGVVVAILSALALAAAIVWVVVLRHPWPIPLAR